jgi:hypothetical protein
MFHDQCEQKNGQIFGNVAKTVAKISKLKLKVQNIHTQTHFECLSKYNKPCIEIAYLAKNVKNAQIKSSQTAKFRPIWSHCS